MLSKFLRFLWFYCARVVIFFCCLLFVFVFVFVCWRLLIFLVVFFFRTGVLASNAKFVHRQLRRHPECLPLLFIAGMNCANTNSMKFPLLFSPFFLAVMLRIGHHSSMSRTYKLALSEYFKAFKLKPDDPWISLSIGMLQF